MMEKCERRPPPQAWPQGRPGQASGSRRLSPNTNTLGIPCTLHKQYKYTRNTMHKQYKYKASSNTIQIQYKYTAYCNNRSEAETIFKITRYHPHVDCDRRLQSKQFSQIRRYRPDIDTWYGSTRPHFYLNVSTPFQPVGQIYKYVDTTKST